MDQHLFNEEVCLLGAIFQDPKAIFKVYSTLSPKDFHFEKYGFAFAAMRELAKENIQIEVFSVHDRVLKNGCNYLDKNELFAIAEGSVSSAANIEYYADMIKDNSNRRALLGLGGKIKPMCDNGEKIEDIESKIYEELNALGRKNNEPKNAAESIAALDEMIQQNKYAGLPTGINALDRRITGMRAGEMIVLAAPPSVGKTALAISIANNVIMSGKTVAFFSLEMTNAEITTRFISLNSQVNSRSIINGTLNYGDREKILAGVKRFKQTKIFIDDSSEIKVAEMRMKCSAIKCKTGSLDLVVVDYLQLIESGKKENQTIAMGDISRSLKIMAKELDVPVLCLSQLNRGYKDGKISLFNLRDSGNIEQDANQVWFISFPIDFAKENEKDKCDPKHAKLDIAKNRSGEKGVVDLQYEAEYTLFTDYDYSRLNKDLRKADADGFFPPDV